MVRSCPSQNGRLREGGRGREKPRRAGVKEKEVRKDGGTEGLRKGEGGGSGRTSGAVTAWGVEGERGYKHSSLEGKKEGGEGKERV